MKATATSWKATLLAITTTLASTSYSQVDNRGQRIRYHTLALVLLLLLASPAWAQDETLQPNADNNPSNVFNDACTTACNAALCDDDVDEGVGSADGLEVSTTTTDATITFDFPTPASNPSTSTNAQTMNLIMSRCDDDANCTERTGGTGDPIFDAYITCSGADQVTLYTDEIITTTDQAKNVSFTFPGACSADGSDLGIRFVLTDQGGGPNKNYPCIEAIDWAVTYAGVGPTPQLILISGP